MPVGCLPGAVGIVVFPFRCGVGFCRGPCCIFNVLRDILVVPSFWLLQTKLSGMFVCSCLYGHMFSFLWDIYPGVHLLAIAGSYHKCILNFFFKKLPNSFQSGCPILYSCQQCMSVPVPRQHLVLSLFLIFAIIILSKLQISLP